MQRGRRPPDPQRGQLGRPAADPPRRGDLQRRQRHGRGEQLLPGRLALRRAPRGVPAARSRSCAAARHRPPAAQIVFEGNLPAVASKNHLLDRPARRPPTGPSRPRPTTAWLGEAIAIKDPTAAVFRPQSGSNLLIVGQNDEAALAMMRCRRSASPRSTRRPARRPCRFYLLDGSPVDSPLAGQLGQLADVVPHPVKDVTWRDAGRASSPSSPPRSSAGRRPTPAEAPTDLPVHLRPPAVPRPPQGGRRLRLLVELRRGEGRPARRSSSATSSATARRWASTRSSGATA